MAPRALGALLAIVAAIAFVVSIASSSWWSGHPTVQGRERATQHVRVGLTGAKGCNTGGDGSCAHIDTGGNLAAAGYLELAVLVAGVVVAFLVAVSSWQLWERRKQLGSVGRAVAIAGAVGALLVLLLGPDIKASQQVSVPIGWGTFVTAFGIGALAVASSIARKLEPEALRPVAPVPLGLPDPNAMFGAPNVRPLYEAGPTPSPLEVGQPVALSTLLGNAVAASNNPYGGASNGPYGGAPNSPYGGASNSPYGGAPNGPYGGAPNSSYGGAPTSPYGDAGGVSYGGVPSQPHAGGGSGPYAGAPYPGAPPSGPYADAASVAPAGAASPSAAPLGPYSSVGAAAGRPATIPPPMGPYSSVARPGSSSVPPPVGRAGSSSVPPPVRGPRSSAGRSGSQSVPPPIGRAASSPTSEPSENDLEGPTIADPSPSTRPSPPKAAIPSMSRTGAPSSASSKPRPKTPSIPGAPITTPDAYDDTQLAATPFALPPKPRLRTTPGPGTDPAARPLPGMRGSAEPPPLQRGSAPTLSHSVPPPPTPDALPPPPQLPASRPSGENVTAVEIDAEAKAAAKARDARSKAQPAHEPTDLGGIDPRMPAAPIGDATDTGLSIGNAHVTDDTNPNTDIIDVPATSASDGGEEDTSVGAVPEGSPSAAALSTAPDSLPPPSASEASASGPTPACPQCESPMAWVEEHLRFYCKSCRMYF